MQLNGEEANLKEGVDNGEGKTEIADDQNVSVAAAARTLPPLHVSTPDEEDAPPPPPPLTTSDDDTNDECYLAHKHDGVYYYIAASTSKTQWAKPPVSVCIV